jgi:uncharacterized SAM-binding protein YcdF (DUF218 family)
MPSLNYLLWDLAGPHLWFFWGAIGAALALAFGRRRWALWLAGLSLLLAFVVFLSPLGAWLIRPLEQWYPRIEPQTIDGVVLLAGAERLDATAAFGGVEVSSAGERLMATAMLAHAHPQAPVILVGGIHSQDKTLTDIAIAERFLRRVGVAPTRLKQLTNTRNTFENAQAVAALGIVRSGQTWLLVTSASHMPRAVGSFWCQGIAMTPYPVDYRWTPGASLWNLHANFALVSDALREWTSLALYRSRGRFCQPRS